MSSDDETWFEVERVADVVDESGAAIGRIRPGQRFRADAVEDDYVVVPGPGGAVGRVDRSVVRFETTSTPEVSFRPDAPIDRLPRSDPMERGAPDTVITPTVPGPAGDGIDVSTIGSLDHTVTTPPSAPSVPHASSTPSAESAPPTPTVPAGWLPDPDRPEVFIRYWNGVNWTDDRAPAPPAGATATSAPSPSYAAFPPTHAAPPVVETGRQPLGGRSLARLVGAIVVVWSGLSIVRVAALTNGWGDDAGYGLTDDGNPWWFATSLWWQFYGSLAADMEEVFAPGGSVLASPLWMFTALVGLLGFIVLVTPRKGARWSLLVFSAVHLIAGPVIGYNGSFANESINTLLRASLVPLLTVLCMAISLRQRAPMPSVPTAGGSFDSSVPHAPPPTSPV